MMRQIDKQEDPPPTLGAPINRPPPAAPQPRKLTDNVSEVAGRMFTEIARNVAAPPEQPAKPPSSTTEDDVDWGICCAAVGWFKQRMVRP